MIFVESRHDAILLHSVKIYRAKIRNIYDFRITIYDFIRLRQFLATCAEQLPEPVVAEHRRSIEGSKYGVSGAACAAMH